MSMKEIKDVFKKLDIDSDNKRIDLLDSLSFNSANNCNVVSKKFHFSSGTQYDQLERNK